MISFKEFYESIHSPNGNYVSAKVSFDNSDIQKTFKIESGKFVPKSELHVTLMYSKETSIDTRKIEDLLSTIDFPLSGTFTHAASFDSKDSDGNATGLATLVLEIDCPEVVNIHQELMNIGLKHSYDEYRPHCSLVYNIDAKECSLLVDKLNKILDNTKYSCSIHTPKAEPIDTDYVSKL